jgi:enamine deaminase RidA (YjgF/YER057c/UK114 family)
MRKPHYLSFLVLLVLLHCGPAEENPQQENQKPSETGQEIDAEKRIEELGIALVMPNPPTANYLKAKRAGNIVYLAGHGPDKPDGTQVIGRLGEDMEVEAGYEAARYTGISLLSSLKAEIGDLNKVKNIVRAQGMVNAHPSFKQHSQVINGFSDLMVEVFGEKGKHARAAIGMSSLPNNIAVEIDMIVELKE